MLAEMAGTPSAPRFAATELQEGTGRTGGELQPRSGGNPRGILADSGEQKGHRGRLLKGLQSWVPLREIGRETETSTREPACWLGAEKRSVPGLSK